MLIVFLTYSLHSSNFINTLAQLNSAERIHFSTIVVDTHCDTLNKILDENGFPHINLGENTNFDVDILKLYEGGINIQFFAVWAPERYYPGQVFQQTLALLNGLHYTIERNPYAIGLASSINDIDRLVQGGRIVAIAAIEGADSLKEPDGSILLQQYYDLGVRVIAPTWNDSNQLAEGCRGTYYDNTLSPKGLSDFGKQIIKEANQLGLIIDVSHLSQASFWDVMDLIEEPVIASHSGVYSLKKHARNLTDEQIIAIAEKGGVVQILYHKHLLADPGTHVTVKTVVDHFDYVINLVGIDHVGLGSDFDGRGCKMPEDLTNTSMVVNITQEMLRRGYSKTGIEKILGKNTLRLLSEVWKESAPTHFGDNNLIPIIPSHTGEIIQNPYPTLSARISDNKDIEINDYNWQVILDGMLYPHQFQESTGTISILLKEQLQEGFHVITFAATNHSDKTIRQTMIFYTEY